MVVYNFRILVGPSSSWSQEDANKAVNDWMNKQVEWDEDTTEHLLKPVTQIDVPVEWLSGTYRLTYESEPKENIFQKLEDKLKNKPDWYRVALEIECGHDENEEPCQYDEQRDWPSTADIPEGVPSFV